MSVNHNNSANSDTTSFYRAVREGNVELVKSLLKTNIDVNYKSRPTDGSTSMLYVAVEENYLDIVRLLLEHGADVNAEDEHGDTPLFAALCEETDDEIFDLLVQYGANVNHINKCSHVALHRAFDDERLLERKVGYSKIIKLTHMVSVKTCLTINGMGKNLLHFLEHVHQEDDNNDCCDEIETKEKDQKEEPTESKCSKCTEYIEILLASGVSVNKEDMFGRTPLHAAFSAKCPCAVNLLLLSGATMQRENVASFLQCLCKSAKKVGFESCLQLILSTGCSINTLTSSGRSCLHAFASSDVPEVYSLNILLENGADINIKDHCGNTPLHELVAQDTVEEMVLEEERQESITACTVDALKLLIEKGININEKNNDGLTALHIAVETSRVEVVKALIELGADIAAKSKTGETPLHRSTMYAAMVKTILPSDERIVQGNFSVNVRDSFGATPLHCAVWNKEVESIVLLLANDADEHICDMKGRTAFDLLYILDYESILSPLGIVSKCKQEHAIDHGYAGTPTDAPFKEPDHYDNLYEAQEILQSFAQMKISEVTDDCIKDDVFCTCRILTRIYSQENQVSLDQWKSHLPEHKQSINEYVNLILFSTSMGLSLDTIDNRYIAYDIEMLMSAVARRIEEDNPLLQCNLELTGGTHEGTKVSLPDEFDYSFQLTKFHDAFSPEEPSDFPKGFVRLRLKDKQDWIQFEPFIDENGYLDGVKVITKLYRSFNSSIRDLLPPTCFYPVKLLDPNTSSIDNIKLRWSGATYKWVTISIDIVPTIFTPGWKPTNVCTDCALLSLLDIVPKNAVVLKTASAEFVKGWNTYFRFSIASLEAAVIKAIPLPIRKGYIITKALNDSYYLPPVEESNDPQFVVNCITTYMLKSSFLFELETALYNPDIIYRRSKFEPLFGNERDDKRLAIHWAKRIVQRLYDGVQKNDVPAFFMNDVNLLVNRSGKVIYDPECIEAQCICLQSLVNLLSSEE